MATKKTVDTPTKVKPTPRTKVISMRVTAEEYEAITATIGCITGLDMETRKVKKAKSQGDVLRYWANLNIEGAVSALRKSKKNAEAAAKRKATRDAKKAANDTI